MTWKPGDPDRRRTQTRCQGEVFEQINELKDGQIAIEKQLGILIAHIESEKGNMVYVINRLTNITEKHEKTLFGDGTKYHLGNCERLNTLETIEENRAKHLMVLWSAVIVSVVKTCWDFFTGK